MKASELQVLRDACKAPDLLARLMSILGILNKRIQELEDAKRTEYGEGILTGLKTAKADLIERLGI